MKQIIYLQPLQIDVMLIDKAKIHKSHSKADLTCTLFFIKQFCLVSTCFWIIQGSQLLPGRAPKRDVKKMVKCNISVSVRFCD